MTPRKPETVVKREYPTKYPIYLAVRITKEQNVKLVRELKKGQTQSQVIRKLIDTL